MITFFSESQLEKGVDLIPSSALSSRLPEGQGAEFRVKAGLPLHISWTTFYTGDVTNRKAIRRRNRTNKPLLLTAAIKPSADAQPALRGFIASKKESKDREEFFPSATESGASVLYYSSAVDRGLTVTVDLFEKAEKTKKFSVISDALKVAANFPPLGFASGFLLMGSTILKISGNVVGAVQKDRLSFSSSQQIYVDTKAKQVVEPRYSFFSPAQLDMEEQYQILRSDRGIPYLADKARGSRYSGEHPYLICRYVQKEVPGLLDYDLQAKALELLKDWKPKEGTDPQELLTTLADGLKQLNKSVD